MKVSVRIFDKNVERQQDFQGIVLGITYRLTSEIMINNSNLEGFRREPQPALDFIRRKFTETQPQHLRRQRMIYTHETEATGIKIYLIKDGFLIMLLRLNLKYC